MLLNYIKTFENGDEWGGLAKNLIFDLLYTILIMKPLSLLDSFTKTILPLLLGDGLFKLTWKWFKDKGIIEGFFTLFFIILGFVIIFMAFLIIIKKRKAERTKQLLSGIFKATFFITITPILFIFITQFFFTLINIMFKTPSTALANWIYRLGYNHKTSNTYLDIPAGGFTGYNWLVVILTEIGIFLIIWKILLPVFSKIIELILLFALSPLVGFYFLKDEKKFLLWKTETISRFLYIFSLQFLWNFFIVFLFYLTSNPLNFEIVSHHIFIAFFIFSFLYFTNQTLELIQKQFGGTILSQEKPTQNPYFKFRIFKKLI